MNIKILYNKFFLLFFAFSLGCSAQSIPGKVIAITDGDTFKLLTQDSIVHRIRVANIDCPEKKQPFTKRAKQFTSDAIFGKYVEVEFLSKDRYGRVIGKVSYHESFDLAEELLKNGYAWHYVKYSKDSILQGMEDDARAKKIGLWQDKNAIPPWEWRANKKTKKTTKKTTKKNQQH
jgi:endonuclease YncB( thermonuclease family)